MVSHSTVPQKSLQPTDLVAFRERVSFGLGAFPETGGAQAFVFLASPVYQIMLGVSPVLVGAVLTIMRIWDGLTDPVMAGITDNARTRWGRRKPFIVTGSILAAFLFPAVWIAPVGWSEVAYGFYFLITAVAFLTAHTIFCVPYSALGLERTHDSHEETRLWAYRSFFIPVITLALNWAFALVQSNCFESPRQGLVVFSCVFSLLMLGGGLASAFFVKERVHLTEMTPRIPMLTSLRVTLQCLPFRMLLAATILVIIGISLMGQIGLYLKIYYVCRGDVMAGAVLSGWIGTTFQLSSLLSVSVITYAAKRLGKHRTLFICLSLQLLANLATFFVYDPNYPYLIIVASVLGAPGSTGSTMLTLSILSDIAQSDERKTGTNRTAMFGGILSWVTKLGYTLTGVLSGIALLCTGFDASLKGNQSASTFLSMRILYMVVPAVCIGLAFFFFRAATRATIKLADGSVAVMEPS